MAYRRSKTAREEEYGAVTVCPEPCGKRRFLSRAAARAHARKSAIPTHALRPYPGLPQTCCEGFWHLQSANAGRTAYYRDRRAWAAEHGLPDGWTVATWQAPGGRWRYGLYPPGGEECTPSVYTYMSKEAALAEAVADVLGESRSA